MVEEFPQSDMSEKQRHTASLLQRLMGKRTADRYADFCRLAAGIAIGKRDFWPLHMDCWRRQNSA